MFFDKIASKKSKSAIVSGFYLDLNLLFSSKAKSAIESGFSRAKIEEFDKKVMKYTGFLIKYPSKSQNPQ